MNNKELNICIASDDNYAVHMHTAIFSIIYNLNKNYHCNVYILDWWISDKKKKWIKDMENEFWNLKIEFILMDGEKYSKLPILHHLTKEMYYRIEIPNLFKNIERMVYLDCDVIINQDLSKILDYNIENYAIGAPNDFWSYNAYKNILNIPSGHDYFNSGMLLMNLNYWRDHNISKQIFDYINNNSKWLVTWDQDAINAVCHNKRLILPLKYNATALAFQPINWNFPKNEYHEAKHNPVVIHYACAKPRNKRCFHSKRKLYHKYRKLAWLHEIKYPKWFDFHRLRKSIIEVIWNFLIAAIPSNIYYHLVWKPKIFLSKFIKF